jgi:hypothetical protein
LLQLGIAAAAWRNGTPTRIGGSMFNDRHTLCRIGLSSPTATAHLSHVEVLGHCPTKALLHGLVKVV